MQRAGLSWGFHAGIALVVILALGTSFWLFKAEVERLRDEELTGQLLAEARLLGLGLHAHWAARDAGAVAGMVRALRHEGTDVVVLAADGTVLLSTLAGSAVDGHLLEQPEVREALRDGWGASTRSGIHGPTLSRVVAVRVGSDRDELGVVWLGRPRWTFAIHARSFARAIALVGVVALATVLGLGLVLTRRWSRLLQRLTRAAQSLADGDLSARAEVAGADEFALLARSLNETRRRLVAHANTIDRQRRTLESLLDQLQEGVIATDGNSRIILANPAALRLLDLGRVAGPGGLLNQPVEQCVPQPELQRLLSADRPQVNIQTSGGALRSEPAAAAADGLPVVEEEQLRIETDAGLLHVLARASDLRLSDPAQPAGGAATGRLVVLTDITALRRAAELQTEFVANASHELRTPLSSIRAAVETLLQMDLTREGAKAGRFVEMIDRHSARLAALAADLLDLSRIQSVGTAQQAATLELGDVLRELTERFAEAVRAKGLHWRVDWSPGEQRTIVTSAHLLRLVLDNLADNAIQFTDPGGHVTVACQREPGRVIFEVQDDGCGIPEAEQQRVFERFYQVERARSGPRRGTGLGLAIVRDAVTAMGGSVQLRSRPGTGTRVTVNLPQHQ